MAEPGLVVYERGDAITDARLGREGLRSLHRAWHAARARADGRIPAWRDLDPSDYEPCRDNIMLLEVLDGGEDYRYTRYGSDIARNFGSDMTGRRTSELPSVSQRLYLALYRRMVADGVPFFTRTDAAPSLNVAQWDRLCMPLSEDGVAVTGIVTGSYPVAWRTPPDLHPIILQSLDRLDEGLAVFDPRRELSVWNHAYVRHSGIEPTLCVRGVSLGEIVAFFARRGDLGDHGSPEALAAAHLERLGAEQQTTESRNIAGGRVVEIRRATLPEGGLSEVWTDVTLPRSREAQLASAQAELVRSERLAAIGELMATVSHELRNPLATVRSSVAVLQRRLEPGPSEPVAAVLERIERNVIRCVNITHELLDYARERPLDRQRFALDPWLARTLDELDVPAAVAMSRALDAGVEVDADRERLRQALVNVVENAWQALDTAPEGPREVHVASACRAGRVEIAVRDSGPGIQVADLDQIFEPLYSTKSRGVGLGLPLVRRILEQHGGGVTVAGAPREGARVTLWLPQRAPEARAR